MTFTKTFPKTSDKSVYPKWIEIDLTIEEEKEMEEKCRVENVRLLKECIDDAMGIVKEKELKRFQNDMIKITMGLFEKRASHEVFWKEKKAKEKFDILYPNRTK